MSNPSLNISDISTTHITRDQFADLPALKQDSELYNAHADTAAEMIAKGCSLMGVAGILGVSRSSLERWAKLEQFEQLISRKREERRLKMLANIEKASEEPKAWQAGAWILERTYRGEYDPPNVKHDVDITVAIFKHLDAQVIKTILDDTPMIEAEIDDHPTEVLPPNHDDT